MYEVKALAQLFHSYINLKITPGSYKLEAHQSLNCILEQEATLL